MWAKSLFGSRWPYCTFEHPPQIHHPFTFFMLQPQFNPIADWVKFVFFNSVILYLTWMLRKCRWLTSRWSHCPTSLPHNCFRRTLDNFWSSWILSMHALASRLNIIVNISSLCIYICREIAVEQHRKQNYWFAIRRHYKVKTLLDCNSILIQETRTIC